MDRSRQTSRPVAKTTFRVCSPRLRPLPLETVTSRLPERIEAKKSSILEGARKILFASGILNEDDNDDYDDRDTGVSVVYRQNFKIADRALPTLLVVARWPSAEETAGKWMRAVKDMVALVDETFQTTSDILPALDVEMIALERVLPKYLGVVKDRPDIDKAWRDIASLVSNRLEMYEATKEQVNGISLFRLGYSADNEQNPITVYISVDYTSDENQWDEIIDHIRRGLRDEGWAELSIHIEHNTIDTCLFD